MQVTDSKWPVTLSKYRPMSLAYPEHNMLCLALVFVCLFVSLIETLFKNYLYTFRNSIVRFFPSSKSH